MANYTAADVKKLRELTGAGMMDCKKALDEAEGEVDKAVELLRVKGQKGVAKREGRNAENGAVVSLIADDHTSGVLLELKCETDFVAKGEKFQSVAGALAEHVAKTAPADIEALLSSEIEAGKTVQAYVDEANANLGEKIVLDRFAQFPADGGYVAAYMHRTMPDLPPQVGVLVELDKENAEIAKDVAQHIAAFSPKYLTREEVPADVVENERRVAEATSREEGKPEAALPKIVEGRVNGFFKDVTLLDQPFAKDNKKSVKKVLDEAGVTLKRFARIRVGA
jgi:elongation factor Ts